MSEPRAITVHFTVHTADLTADDVRLRLLAAVGDQMKIHNITAYDLADIPDSPDVQLVVCPVRGLLGAYVNDEGRANAHAEREGAVVGEVGTIGDYRGEVTS